MLMPVTTWSTIDAAAQEALLERPALAADGETTAAVTSIISDVREGGDAALLSLAEKFVMVVPEIAVLGTMIFTLSGVWSVVVKTPIS